MRLRPVRLHPGCDLRSAVEELRSSLPEGSGFLVSGIGSLTHAQLRLANEANEQHVDGPLEIISVSGSVSPEGAHLHMSVANAQGHVFGGHVCRGCEVRTTAELLVAELPGYRLSREHDSTTGFKELVVHRIGPENAA
jgi:predicted DNA-binding protein with PD1-like motif